MAAPSPEDMLERERVANRRKHWVRAVTACNSRCLFCLDSDTPRNVYLPVDEIERELVRGREELDADKVIVSGGEATLHPKFPEIVRYARSIGYDRVQTVTNGYRLADRDFYDRCMEAGLGEITFSLHGHTAELHDRLTQTPGAFHRLMKGMVRALRDSKHRPIVNVDVVINKQNVAVLDKIVELAISVGVTEFDLLHVIPQAAAFDHRDELFYDVREHLPVLHKVFRLNRHPRFVIWTNRFPVSYLEGLEDLIQDPHKMLDEVNGRRWQVRRYLDVGQPLDCRQPERCVHCFIEPFCTTQDRVIERLRTSTAEGRGEPLPGRPSPWAWDVWDVGDPRTALPGERTGTPALPYGCRYLGVDVEDVGALGKVVVPEGAGVYARVRTPGPVPQPSAPLVLVADTAEKCASWATSSGTMSSAPTSGGTSADVLVLLNTSTADWILSHADDVDWARVTVHQPSFEHLSEAHTSDVRDPPAFFRRLGRRIRVSGLPACLAPGMELVPAWNVLPADLFDAETGRLVIRELARFHVREGYTAKSERCRDCVLTDRCDGAHVNFIRDQGLARLQPVEGAWSEDALAQLRGRHPEPLARLATARPPEPPHPSLPGYPEPTEAPTDPLAAIALKQQADRAARLAQINAASAKLTADS